jgi:hypothetical protein
MNTQTTQQPKVYSLFNQSGKMQELKPADNLPLYCLIYSYGYGMEGTLGAIISEPNEYGSYKAVYLSDYKLGFFSVDKYSRPHSQKFGIGTYYHDEHKTADKSEVLKYIEAAKQYTREQQEKEQQQANADKLERENLPALYPYLTINKEGDRNITKANLVAELKNKFPNVKFSVKKSHYSTYNVEWTNGPTLDEVSKITGKFEDSCSSYCGDFRDYNPSNFNRVFGGFKYVFENRRQSEEINALLPKLSEKLNCAEVYPESVLYKIFAVTSIPKNANNFDIIETGIKCGSLHEFYKISFDVPQETNQSETELKADIFLIEYTDKAVAVFGDTKSIKDQLKQIGGRFNAYLTHNGEKRAGWIFPKTKSEELKKLIK